jgi:hypothetical protein
MQTYETSATVENQGQIHVAGLPFKPGTRVEVTITAAENGAELSDATRLKNLLAALDKARNTNPIGRLSRDELYDRDILR